MGNFCNKKTKKNDPQPQNPSPVPISNPIKPPLPLPKEIAEENVENQPISSNFLSKSPQISSLNWNSNLFNKNLEKSNNSNNSLAILTENIGISKRKSQFQRKSSLFSHKNFNKESYEMYFPKKSIKKHENFSFSIDKKSKSALRIVSLLSENESISHYKLQKHSKIHKILENSVLEPDELKILGLLAQRSNINHHNFPLWESKIHENYSFYLQNASFTDFSFDRGKNVEIEAMGYKWMRIRDFENADIGRNGVFSARYVKQNDSKTCSVIASLITISNFKGISTDILDIPLPEGYLLHNSLFPRLENKNFINKAGKYGVKLHSNGGMRYIELDDFLLYNPIDKHFYGASSPENLDFWISLFEKALIKFYGDSYMEIDSNAAYETFHLIGWVPEIIRLCDIINKVNLWTRLYQNYKEGNFLINVGTFDVLEEISYFLIAKHTYSVLEMRESASKTSDIRLIKLRNPWGVSTPSPIDNYPEIAIENDDSQGIFWLDWGDFLKTFSTIYLNWNPEIYPYIRVFHSKWLKGPMKTVSKLWNERYSLEYNPQYLIRIPPHSEDFEIRVMLERHITETSMVRYKNIIGFMLFPYEGERTIFSKDFLKKTGYSARELISDVLIFEASEQEDLYVLVVLKGNIFDIEYLNVENETHFSIKFMSFLDINVMEMPFRGIKAQEIRHGVIKFDGFKGGGGGGSLASPYFYRNPQWDIEILREMDLRIQVEGPDDCQIMAILINIFNFKKKGDLDIRNIDFKNILQGINQGFFMEGISHIEAHLMPGSYRLVIANKAKISGEFKVFFNELADDLKELPILNLPVKPSENLQIRENSLEIMKIMKKVIGEWNTFNSKGVSRIKTNNFQGFFKNPGYIINFQAETIRISFNMKSIDYESLYIDHIKTHKNEENFDFEPPSLSFCLYVIEENLKFKVFSEDSTYLPTAWGPLLGPLDLYHSPYGYLLLCLNYEKGYEGSYELCIESDDEVSVISNNMLLKLEGMKEIEDIWDKNNSGGCCCEVSFYRNPQFSLKFLENNDNSDSNIRCYIELESPMEYPIGIYVLDCEGVLLEDSLTRLIYVETNEMLLREINVLPIILKNNRKYTLLACTHKPDQYGEFKLTVHAEIGSERIILKKMQQNEEYLQKKTYLGVWKENGKKSIKIQTERECKVRMHLFNIEDIKCGILIYDINDLLINQAASNNLLNFGCFITIIVKDTIRIDMKMIEKTKKNVNFCYEIEWNSETNNCLKIIN